MSKTHLQNKITREKVIVDEIVTRYGKSIAITLPNITELSPMNISDRRWCRFVFGAINTSKITVTGTHP